MHGTMSVKKRCIFLVVLCELFNTVSDFNEKALNYVLSEKNSAILLTYKLIKFTAWQSF